MAVTWCDPPPDSPTGPSTWWGVLVEVTERPGEWARLRVFDSARPAHEAAKYLRQARCPKPAGSWTFGSRKFEGGYGVWAKWEPEGSSR